MYSDNSSTDLNPGISSPQKLYRGLYVRIARKLGVDPSYVSRVARGARRSSQVESALREELDEINHRLGRSSSSGERRLSRPAGADKRLKVLIKQNRNRIGTQWMLHSQADPNLRKVRIPARERTAPILSVIEETMKVMKLSLREMVTTPMKAAERHGRLRQAQGFSAMALIEEYNLVRRCVFGLAQAYSQHMDPNLLIQDLTQFGEALDLQTQRAVRDYLAAA